MSLRALTITHEDRAWHEAFLSFVPRVFRSIDFRTWHGYGGWDERYRAFALAEGGRLVASASLQRMELVLHGRRVRGWQLGAVGTLPEHRRRGLQNEILPRLLEHTGPDDVVFLFANPTVLDFYPRFGFERVAERHFVAAHRAPPSGEPLRALDLASAGDRALLARVAAAAEPVTTRFGARDYGGIVLWYWCNFFPRALRYAPEHDAIVVADQTGAVLHLYDVLAPAPLELRPLLPRLIAGPIEQIEFGFLPERFWPNAVAHAPSPESPLFARVPHDLPREPFQFPALAHT